MSPSDCNVIKMTSAYVELTALKLKIKIRTYGPREMQPRQHLLDLKLWIDPKLVLIDEDRMDRVFDYDDLIHEIDLLAGGNHYETQERLITLIVEACASHSAIESVEIGLIKFPVRASSGNLGIRLHVDAKKMAQIRKNLL